MLPATRPILFAPLVALLVLSLSRPSYALWPFDESKQWFKCEVSVSTRFLGYSIPFTSGNSSTEYIAVTSKDIYGQDGKGGVVSISDAAMPAMKKAAEDEDLKNKVVTPSEIQRSYVKDSDTALLTIRVLNADSPLITGVFQMRLGISSGELTMGPVGISSIVPSNGYKGVCVPSSAP